MVNQDVPELPPLRKVEKDGKVRMWEIIIDIKGKKIRVYTRSGYEGGKIRETKPSLFKPSKQKSAKDLAITYAQRKWTSHYRRGYRPVKELRSPAKIEKVKGSKKQTQVKKFVLPMSSYPIDNYTHKIIFPAWLQPKLDGFRGLARRSPTTGEIQIVSRRGLSFPHLKVLKGQLNIHPWLKKSNAYLDGEIYLHGKPIGDIHRILGRKFLNSQYICDLESQIRFCVFDGFKTGGKNMEMTFVQRWKALQKAFKEWRVPVNERRAKLVNTIKVKNLAEVKKKDAEYIKKGFEGIVVRNSRGLYTPGKRSMDVIRTKEFKRATFQIADAIEARGDNKGTVVWVMRCLNKPKYTFLARPMGTREERKEWWKNRKKYIGQWMEVKYMELEAGTGCVSRFPVAIKFVPDPKKKPVK